MRHALKRRTSERRHTRKKLDPTSVSAALARTMVEVQNLVKAIEKHDPAMALITGGCSLLESHRPATSLLKAVKS